MRDDYWDSLNTAPSAGLGGAVSMDRAGSAATAGGAANAGFTAAAPGAYEAVPTTASSYEYAKSYDPYTTPDSEEDIASVAIEAAPRGVGIVRHEFEAEGEEELTVDLGDKVVGWGKVEGLVLGCVVGVGGCSGGCGGGCSGGCSSECVLSTPCMT